MATTIKYKNLWNTALKYIPVQNLFSIRDDLIEQANELRDRESYLTGMELTRLKNEIKNLEAQIELVNAYINLYSDKPCELCNKPIKYFSMNICEECFDKETDKLYEPDEE